MSGELPFDLRTYVYIDRMQPQFASFIGTVARGFLPVAGQAGLYIETHPALVINQVIDVALKRTSVRPALMVSERAFGVLELHHDEQAEVRAAGAAVLSRFGLEEEDRLKPRVVADQVIRKVDDYHSQIINRMRHGHMLIPGKNLYILEVEPAGYASIAANEAEKMADIFLLEVNVIGQTGRLYLSGEEEDINEARRAAVAALERLAGRERR